MGLSLITHPTIIEGCKSVLWKPFVDDRGAFYEIFNKSGYEEIGLPTEWPQDNFSSSKAGVLRGLHIQSKNSQGKLVMCLSGRIWDVCVDVRPNSPSFKKWHVELLEGNKALYCPPGTAHGFYAVEDSKVYYKCTTLYDKDSDGGIFAYDSDLAIPWDNFIPRLQKVTMSDKDAKLPSFQEYMERNNGR